MADERVTILDVQVNAAKAIKTITEYRARIDDLKAALKEEETQNGKNTEQAEIYRAEIASLNKDLRENVKQLGNQVTEQKNQEGSLVSLRAKLSQLTSEYDRLSREERLNTEVGGALMVQINRTTAELKAAEEATQRYYRNVGNYTNAITKALGANNKYVLGLQAMNDVFKNGLAQGLKMTTDAVGKFGKQMLALLANPIVLVVTAIAAAFMALKEGIASSEENTQALQKVLAPLKGLFDLLSLALQKFTAGILSVVQGFEDMALGLAKLMEDLPLVGDAFKKVNAAIEEQNRVAILNKQITEESRKMTVQSAKNELEVAKLRDKVAQAQNYSIKQRREFLQQALDIEKKEAEESLHIAKLKLQALQAEAKTAKNTAEMMDKLAEAEANVARAQAEYYQNTRKMQSQLAKFDIAERTAAENAAKERQERAKKAAEEARKNALERKKNEVEAFKAAQDAVLAILYETAEKRREQLRIQYQREIDDLKNKLKTEKNLTKEAREYINKEILAKQIQLNQELEKLRIQAIQESVANKTQQIQSDLMVAEKGSKEELELNKQLNQQEVDQKIAALAEQKRTLQITEEQFDLQSYNIREAQRQKDAALDEAYNVAAYQRRQQALANQLAELKLKGESILAAERETAQKSLDELIERGKLSSQTQEQFDAEVLQKRQDLANKEKAIDDAKLKVKAANAAAEKALMNSVIGLMEQMGEENKAMAKLAKVLALANIAIDTGEAIAKGIKSAQSVPYPANIEAIASTITSILTGITSAISTVKSAKFATGGKVTGPGTGTSDSIPAQLSNGEYVMTAKATAFFEPLLAAMNGIGAGVPMQVSQSGNTAQSEGALREAFTEAAKNIRPVVSVVDINEGQQRVEAIQNLDTL